jgi:hypothetical protein
MPVVARHPAMPRGQEQADPQVPQGLRSPLLLLVVERAQQVGREPVVAILRRCAQACLPG